MPVINGIDFKLGADPELFVKTRKSKQLVSAHDLIPGTKKDPYKVKNGAVQVDGMALEFNIDPVDNFDAWETNLNSVMDSLQKMVPEHEFFINPVADFGEELIRKVPEDARRLGCEPDFNAYTKDVNPVPNAKAPFRTASGHVHIGWQKDPVDPYDPGHFEACCLLTKALDQYLAIPSFIWDRNMKRRELYGKAGAFRPKPYGMEYRVLSNRWINVYLDYESLSSEVPEERIVMMEKSWGVGRDELPKKISHSVRKLVYHNTLLAIKKLFDNPDFINMEVFNFENEEYGKIDVRTVIDKGMMKNISSFIDTYSIPTPLYYK